jgi:predicted MFS family arabinose efflux permease
MIWLAANGWLLFAINQAVRVRRTLSRARALSGEYRTDRVRYRSAAHRDAARRHLHLVVSDDASRPDGAPPDVDRRRRVDGGGWPRVRFTTRSGCSVIAGTTGVVSPSGQEVGPFLPIEQAALSQVVPDRARTDVFAWYTVAGSLATALGALAAGMLTQTLQTSWAPVDSIERSSSRTRPLALRWPTHASLLGVRRSQRMVLKLSALFALDSFGGGFVVQSCAAYWFYRRFGVDPQTLGILFFAPNVLAGISALLASRLASRIGLINTMVVTHLPSNVLLILIPLMPTLQPAALMLLVRFSISQMDVPTRQSYVMAVVDAGERSAASGITAVARTTGAALSPLFAGWLFAQPSLISVPLLIAGSLKIAYDLLLFRVFRAVTAGRRRLSERQFVDHVTRAARARVRNRHRPPGWHAVNTHIGFQGHIEDVRLEGTCQYALFSSSCALPYGGVLIMRPKSPAMPPVFAVPGM